MPRGQVKPVSLREQARAYLRLLEGDAAEAFRKTFKEVSESSTVQKAFSAAKIAAEKAAKASKESS